MMLSVIVLFMLMTLLPIVNLSGLRIFGNSTIWHLNFNLTFKTLWIMGGRDLLILMLGLLNIYDLII